MRKFMMILTLTISFLAVSASATNVKPDPPSCDPNCPSIR